MRIEVTQSDIESGIPCSAYHCPVSRAVKRALVRRADARVLQPVADGQGRVMPRGWTVYVSSDWIDITCDGHKVVGLDTPDRAAQFVGNFDMVHLGVKQPFPEVGIKPFAFELPLETLIA